ncbi:MAG: hypothetical protein RIM80_07110 [Alphaproteobacteria bacterium]
MGNDIIFWSCALVGLALIAGGGALMTQNTDGWIVVLLGALFLGAGALARWAFKDEGGHIFRPPSADEAASMEANAAALAGRRFAGRPDWVSGRVEAEAILKKAPRRAVGIFWIGAFAVSVVVGLFVGKAAWGFALVTGLMAGVVVYLLAQDRIRERKFGQTLFLMDETPARLGGALRGQVATGIPLGDRPADGFHVRLRCYSAWEERQRNRDGSVGSGRRIRREKTHWETETRAAPKTGADGKVAAPVHIDLPGDAPPSVHDKGEEGTFWELRLTAKTPGVDYDARFRVPVLDENVAV